MFEGLRAEMRRPATVIAVALGVFGIIAGGIISLYFYNKSIMVGKIYYRTQQILVFDQSKLSAGPLFVVDEAGNKINSNIYAVTIKIWNAGNDEIRQDEIRIPFKVNVSGSATIVDSAISYATMDNVDSFSVGKNGSIGWAHFDPKQGVTVRLIYAAKNQEKISVEGYAAKSSSAIDADTVGELSSAATFYWSLGMLVAIVLFLSLMLYLDPENWPLLVAGLVLASAGWGAYYLIQAAGKWLTLNLTIPSPF